MNLLHGLSFLWSLPYVRWHIILTITPSIIIWSIWWRYLIGYLKVFLLTTVGAFLWGLPLDILSVPVSHIYGFNSTQNMGINFLGLPLEEYLFFLLVPQMAVAVTLLIRRILYE